jgi:DNA-3-methyladenine glycosylase II
MDCQYAIKHLSKDPAMAGLIKRYDPPQWSSQENLFEDLVEAIINQQLSDKASATIIRRFRALFGKSGKPTPAKVVKTSDDRIRSCGISYPKIGYIKGLSKMFIDGTLKPEYIKSLSDEKVIEALTKAKGVGKWTAEMILMFTLKRPDVFSTGDLGLRTAVSKLYGVDRNNFKGIEEISLRWKPYRSFACRYLWKSLQNEPK